MDVGCLTIVIESTWITENGERMPEKELLVMYRQTKGYPSGHGKELIEQFGDIHISDKYNSEQSEGKWAKGMGCFAAQVVAFFKKDIGDIYLEPTGTRNLGEQYVYILYGLSGISQDVIGNGEKLLCLKVIARGQGDKPDEILYDNAIFCVKRFSEKSDCLLFGL